jgi:predicted nucleic acid-binding Zn ribbon protein
VKKRRKSRKHRHTTVSGDAAGKSPGDLTPVGEILRSFFSDPGLPFNPDDHRIFEVWDSVVGRDVALNARPSRIRNGRLRVRVSGPIWLQELEFSAETIRNRINKALGRIAVKGIDFRLGDPGSRP